jgi:hypothetical protein
MSRQMVRYVLLVLPGKVRVGAAWASANCQYYSWTTTISSCILACFRDLHAGSDIVVADLQSQDFRGVLADQRQRFLDALDCGHLELSGYKEELREIRLGLIVPFILILHCYVQSRHRQVCRKQE